MPDPMFILNFDDVNAVLVRAGALSDAAECHGTLSGLLCASHNDVRQRWLDQTLDSGAALGDVQVGECRQMLLNLHDDTRRRLEGDAMDFTPLLPDDNQPLTERVQALRDWVQGFLYGLGIADLESVDQLPPDVREVIQDLTEIARADTGADDQSEQDEAAYAEILEYVRMGSQLVHDELNPPTPAQFRAPPRVQ